MAPSTEDVIRELRYCAYAGWAWHHQNGRLAQAQDEALRRGWLAPIVGDKQRLVLTALGMAERDRWQEPETEHPDYRRAANAQR